MAVPPPPPPGPPPPPALGNIGKVSNTGTARNALLADICKGAKLKKTVTVDKSKPILSGKVNNVGGTDSAHAKPTSNINSSSSYVGNGPKLGGLFEGMATMPRLKPVGGGKGSTTRSNPLIDNPTSQPKTPTRQPLSNVSNGSVGLDFNSELANRLNKMNKPANVPISQKNRGPPPQPPAFRDSEISNDNRSNLPVIGPKRQQGAPLSPAPSPTPINGKASPQIVIPNNTGMPLLPNKSTLFSNASQSPQPQTTLQSPSFTSTSPTPKPIINHGKPNLAPKPPGMVITPGNGRPTVARHQSMRSPRSPPIIGPDGPVFPQNPNKFGTVRAPKYKSTDNINQPFTYPTRPVEPPPKPPGMKQAQQWAPKSISNSNLSNLQLSIGTTLDQSTAHNTYIKNAQSESQLPVLNQNNFSPSRASVSEDAPPLPPHRNPPAIPKQPPIVNKPAVNVLSSGAPLPPARTTSTMHRPNSNQSGTPINRIVSDLESRFAAHFHKVNEFPPPPPFQNMPKTYPSQNINKQSAKAENRKKRAPSPPTCKPHGGILQLNDKLFASESTNC